MDGSVSPKLDSKGSEESEFKQTETGQASKRRKVVERTVVRVKIGENGGKLKNEGPPSDSWSWRKYGQKPIKGSPHPRGYYKCSTSKGCSAKKQVERCKTDASMLIITYTSTHNHPGPQTNHSDDDDDDASELPIKTSSGEVASEDHFHYLHIATNEEEPFSRNLERTTVGFLLDEEPLSCCHGINASSSTQKSEENDFFDELEDLPICSAFTGFMRSKFFDEGIPVVPF